jgi:hypothetical protein
MVVVGWAYPSRSDADSCFVHRMLWNIIGLTDKICRVLAKVRLPRFTSWQTKARLVQL